MADNVMLSNPPGHNETTAKTGSVNASPALAYREGGR